MSKLPILYRAVTPEDLPFIFNSWLEGYRNSEFADHVPNEIYFNSHKALIVKVMAKAQVMVAANSEDPDQIFGYIVFENDNWFITHFMYTKKPFRRLGVGLGLLQNAGLKPDRPHFTTAWTSCFEAVARKKNYPFVYNPYFFFSGGIYDQA